MHAHIFAYRFIGILGRSLPQGDRAGIENAIARGLENMGKRWYMMVNHRDFGVPIFGPQLPQL